MEISQEQFADYENVRVSGLTNMFDTKKVEALSDNLDRAAISYIMKNYRELTIKYPNVRQK